MLPSHRWILTKASCGFFCHFLAHWLLRLFPRRSMLLFRMLQATLLYSSSQISMSLLPLRLQCSRISVVLSPVFLHGCIEDASHKTVLIFLTQWYCTFHLIPLSRTWIRGSRAPLVSLTRHKVGWECWPAWRQEGSAEGSGEAYYLLKFLDRGLEVPGILTILKS